MSGSSFRLCVLAGGSKGNSVLVASDEGSVLVDVGISCKRVLQAMHAVGEDPARLRGIVITHEHGDHILGVGPTARKLKLPVYGTKATLEAAARQVGTLPERIALPQCADFNVGSISFRAFETFHDATDAHGLVAGYGGSHVGILTDVGAISKLISMRLRPCSTLVLEANYDQTMLMQGPYPWALKQRILHNRGHLSNEGACKLVTELAAHRLKRVVFSHLSEKNNSPEKLWETVEHCLDADLRQRLDLHVASPTEPTALLPVD